MNFKEEFPVLQKYTYLNTASSGILSRSIIHWRRSHDAAFEDLGSGFRLTQASFIQEVRSNVSHFFNAQNQQVFLVPNCSIAFNIFLDGLDRSHRFLLLESDYPSVNYPVVSRGFAAQYIRMDGNTEEQIIHTVKTFGATVLALSLVQYSNGAKIDPAFFNQLKSLYPDLLIVVDGTQYCGTERFDFENAGIDVFFSSGYKWMLSGYGNGFLMLKASAAAQLYQDRKQFQLPAESFLSDKGILDLCFEPGHLDTLNFGTLNQSILFMQKTGMDVIENKIKLLAEHARLAFASRSLLDPQISARVTYSPIFNLLLSDALYQKLLDSNISCLSRGRGVRVAFHFYNTADDLDHLLKIIDENI
ncbi:aminotransferase class V-fold PLP-dependent enzyme [Pedobacter sp. MC2016-24]|uniref:aminotransferase class V-fold PLP-dependent enzyme n=1 Tax=Pedobacter sp. MC2016-24 TaxID=2780090 RepID=UPI001882156D|nr:aminotransferase class V-fold PLP-dependent enzyme [Pedobacter sp. MC2016-24]MBE9600860.1 aminotransferase class V-fold PLP-dependent enzyme [Pedobacter sp. MC2016-24]